MRREQGMPVVPYVKETGIIWCQGNCCPLCAYWRRRNYTLNHYHAGVSHNPPLTWNWLPEVAPVKTNARTWLEVALVRMDQLQINDLICLKKCVWPPSFKKDLLAIPPLSQPEILYLWLPAMGANALHIGNITGSLEPGKTQQIRWIDTNQLHNSPHFNHDPLELTRQVILCIQSIGCERWCEWKMVMIDHRLLTLTSGINHCQPRNTPKKIDVFLMNRENSVLSKLIAMVELPKRKALKSRRKCVLKDISPSCRKYNPLKSKILRKRHYKEYDSYSSLQTLIRAPPLQEDDFIDDVEKSKMFVPLDLIGPTKWRPFWWRSTCFPADR